MRPGSHRFSLIALAAGMMVVVAACGTSSSPSSSVAGATATPAPSAAASATPAAAVALGTASTSSLGSFLTGANGMTLYVFKKDGPDKTACTGTCAGLWPPLTVPSASAFTPPASLAGFGTFTRPDGKIQVTFNKRPLYYYSLDTKAGQTNGEGYLGLWYVASTSGAIGPASSAASSAAPSAAPSSSSGGYSY